MDKHEKSFLDDLCAFLINEKKHYETQIYILNNRLQDKAWNYDKHYLNYELSNAINKKNYTIYLLNIIQEKIHQKEKYAFINYNSKYEPEQLKM